MAKLFISADMEGCSSVSAQQALLPDRWAWEWHAARRWMTYETLAVTEAALEAGYDSVIIADSHGNAHNIDPDLLPADVWLVRSWPRELLHMQGVNEPDVTACAFVGAHGAAGSSGSILAHSFSGAAFRSIHLNGEPCSEGYFNAALAGEFGCPVAFISGDENTIDDARRYAPQAGTCLTKKSFGYRSQMSSAPKQTQDALREAARAAFQRETPPPFVLKGPFKLHLEMTSITAAEMLAYLPQVDRVDGWTVASEFQTMADATRFLAFAMLYSPTGMPAL